MFAFFERLIKPFPIKQPEQPPSGLLAFCSHYTRGIEVHLLLMTIVTAAIAVMEVSLFAFLGQLVDWLAAKSKNTFLQEEGYTLFWMGVIILVAIPIAHFLRALIVHQTLLGNYPMVIRWQAHRYLLGQSLSFYQNEFSGRIATKVLQTAVSIREAVMKLLEISLNVLVYFGSMVALAAGADWRLSTALIAWFSIYIALMIFFIPRLEKVSATQGNARSNMVGRIVDTYTNIATVKLFSHARREENYAQEGMSSFLKTVYPQMRLVTGLNMSVTTVNQLLLFAVSATSIWLWLNSNVSAGAITTAIALVLRLNGMSLWLMWETAALFEHTGTVKDGITTLARAHEVQDAKDAISIIISHGEIEYDHVNFHYGKGHGVIDDFSLVIGSGEKIGFVGPSGAGKSTLVNLLFRFYDVEGGEIKIDGVNIKAVSQESLRAKIGVVTQDTSLLHRSIKENILYGRPEASEDEMVHAAKQTRAHDFIMRLRDINGNTGYDVQVGERGVKLSGGQRQRIAIARVLLKDAPILVFDEATSALDSEVEAAIQENLYKLMKGKTVITIAHRLSTIAAMDRLVVLEKGTIIEQGTHENLITQGGLYAQLWARQSGEFIGEVRQISAIERIAG